MTSAGIARVVATARRAAAAAQHAFVGTEHLLAAALEDQEGPGARALHAVGIAPEGLAEELIAGLPRAESDAAGPPPLSRFAERAIAEAEKSGTDLAVVLLRAPRGRIASVLARRGVKLTELHKALEPAGPSKRSHRATHPSAPTSPTARPPTHPPARLPPHLEQRRPPRRIPWSLLLLLAVPASVVLRWQQASALLIFLTACVGVLPLARLLGQATEQLAERTGPTIGGLLNATFGNAAELIIALVALRAGLIDLVKASITGSILGNLLLILGLSLLAGGLRAPLLKFNRTSAGMSAAMLALAVAGLIFPALFHLLHPGSPTGRLALGELQLSEAVALILALTYGASLLFSLRTHRTLFGPDAAATPESATWSVAKAVGVLGLATAGVVLESELLVHSIEPVTLTLGLSQTFLGLIVIPIIGNAAEHAAAVSMAWKGKTDLSLQIALGSSTQVALLIAPLLVLAGVLLGRPLSLLFTTLEVAALGITTVIVSIITLDGESHWFEGVQLLALYGMIGAAAYFL
ncbi:MAG TPA: calcium/proton exchanger [Gemmatimonadales bacterium]|nr:calcium/proton exchanger [Gemmatimonadales bacterium]